MYASFAILALAASTVSAYVVPRREKPATYYEGYLENYQTYHTRYLALGCNEKHGTTFFDQCCHPLLATETVEENRPASCVASPSALSSAAAAEPTSTVSTPADDGEDNDECDDEDEDDDDDSTSSTTPSATHVAAVKPTSTSTTEEATTSKAAPTTTSEAKPTTTSKAEETTTSKATPTTTSSKAAQTTSASSDSGSGSAITGGFATFFYQGGVAGACGKVNSDDALIAAMDVDRYGDTGKQSSLCGKQVKITNTNNGKSVTVTVADACPTCKNGNSIDLSVGAFTKIATEDEGMVPISWEML